MNRKKNVRSGAKPVPSPQTSSPAGQEEIEAHISKEIKPKNTGKPGAPPKPKPPAASSHPLPKPNTSGKKKAA